MHLLAKFHGYRSNCFQDMAIFRLFEMAAVRHLGFLKVQNLNCPHSLESQYVFNAIFHADRSSHFQHIAIFQFLRLQLWIYKSSKF